LYGFWLVAVYAAGLFLLFAGNKFRMRRRLRFSLAGVLLATALIVAGCGSTPTTQNTSKTYQVTITASAPASATGTSAAVSQTQIVSLTVQ
jgi:uncharacterized lipoprotein YmbA